MLKKDLRLSPARRLSFQRERESLIVPTLVPVLLLLGPTLV